MGHSREYFEENENHEGNEHTLSLSTAERMAMVWPLTLECLAWTGADADELRLQRSVCRVKRRGRCNPTFSAERSGPSSFDE